MTNTADTRDTIPPPVTTESLTAQLARAFADSGMELFLVGGAVRDALLGEQDFDLDFATSAHPAVTVDILERTGLGSSYRIGEKYGTIGLRVGPFVAEITTYRSKEVYEPGSRKPEVEFGKTLLDDLSRRDFTINAMARDPATGMVLDPLGGEADLSAGILRAVGNPTERFREDPLRLLRAVRFAARLGFSIEPETRRAMNETRAALASISRERVRDEYSRMLTGPHPARALTLLRNSGLLEESVPGLTPLTQMKDHGPRHPLSLWDHTMRVLEGVKPDLVLRWAALLHDIAKPVTRTHEPSGRPRFFHHEEVGADMARKILTELRYNSADIEKVTLLVGTHMQLHTYTEDWTDGAVRRLMLRLGPLTGAALALARADAGGHALDGSSHNAPKFDELELRIQATAEEPVANLRSPLTGNDLMDRYQRRPGPWIGEVKAALENAVIDGALLPGDRDGAWQIADALVGQDA